MNLVCIREILVLYGIVLSAILNAVSELTAVSHGFMNKGFRKQASVSACKQARTSVRKNMRVWFFLVLCFLSSKLNSCLCVEPPVCMVH